ncbi:MAG: hypothetical protein IKD43_02345 [Clostridia bacterium]|nr:hypothetical protein [Clostridia bacterium]
MKRINCFLIALVIGIMVAFGAVACTPKPPEVEAGCYSLSRAYELGILTKADLQTIAFYNSGRGEYEETLDPQIATAIKEMEAASLRNRENHPIPEATADDFTIEKYLGTYSGCYVLAMDNIFTAYPANGNSYSVAGVEFHTLYYYIGVWKVDLPQPEEAFSSLQQAYDNGWLTKDDLMEIAYYHNGNIAYPEALDERIERSIKETAANNLRNQKPSPVTDAKADDFNIIEFCGAYQNAYAIIIEYKHALRPAVIIDEWIEVEGVRFHYRRIERIQIWKDIG